LSCKWS